MDSKSPECINPRETKTFNITKKYLRIDGVCDIVVGYIMPKKFSAYEVGYSGFYELCLSIYKFPTGSVHSCYQMGHHGALAANHYAIADLMLIGFPYKTKNEKLFNACRYGRIKLAELAIKEGADDFRFGLYVARLYGQLEAARFMSKLKSGAVIVNI